MFKSYFSIKNLPSRLKGGGLLNTMTASLLKGMAPPTTSVLVAQSAGAVQYTDCILAEE